MMTNEKEPEQKDWAGAIKILFPNAADRGMRIPRAEAVPRGGIQLSSRTWRIRLRDNAQMTQDVTSDTGSCPGGMS